MQHLQKTGGPALRHSGAQPCARSGHPHPPAPHSYPHGSLSTDHGSPCHIGISPNPPTLKRMVNHLPCYTVPPWLANASDNTSSPIFIGARRSRAPFAFRRIPLSRSRGTINIAGSKLALVTAKCPSISSPQALPSTPSKSIRLSSPACATSQNYSPISPSSLATFSKPTSPPSLPAAASASTAIFPTTSPRRFFITCSLSPASSTKYT